jgi:hypothetical protein
MLKNITPAMFVTVHTSNKFHTEYVALCMKYLYESCDTSVGKTTSPPAGQQKNKSSIPDTEIRLPLFQIIQNGSGTHASSKWVSGE